MIEDQLEFYNSLRTHFCQCSNCKNIYRLTDSPIFKDVRPKLDWMEKLDREIGVLEEREARLKAKIQQARINATIEGRKAANEHIAQFDTIFKPLDLNPDDAKVQFHPIDYIVFNGMNDPCDQRIRNLVLLDRKENTSPTQSSIASCIHEEKYGFLTIKIREDGTVVEE